MGDRGNVFVVDPYDKGDSDGLLRGVYLYTHWTGTELPNTVARALDSTAGRNRADDHSYLTRVIFDQLTLGEQGQETGFGISSAITDNEHDIVVIHPGVRGVRLAPEGSERDPEAEGWTSFDDFIGKHLG